MAQFGVQKGIVKEKIERALEALGLPIPPHLSIEPVPGALALLDKYKNDYLFALVTLGDPAFQMEKMKKAGIQPEQFSKIVIGRERSKKFYYQAVLDELKIDPLHSLVCGDRVPIDLSPAKELKIFTVHFENGRGVVHNKPKEDINMSIKKLEDLQAIL